MKYFLFTVEIESSFIRGNEKWSVEELNGPTSPAIYHNNLQAIEASAPGYLPVYFVAPGKLKFNHSFHMN